jgi:hypothetical protein
MERIASQPLSHIKNYYNIDSISILSIMKTTTRLTCSRLLYAVLLALLPFSISFAQVYVKSDFAVSAPASSNYVSPQLSVNSNGDMVVVWETSGSGDILFRSVSSKGEVLGDQNSVDTPYTSNETKVAQNDIGNFMVIFGAYLNHWYVMGQSFDPAGDKLADTLRVDRNASEQIDMSRVSLYSNSSNQFAAFLPESDSVLVEMFSENGEYLSNTIVLKPDAQNFSDMYGLMTYAGDLVLAWIDASDGNYWGRIYSGDGTPSGASFQISNKEAGSYVQKVTLCADASGNFAAVWTSATGGLADIYTQLIDHAGTSIGLNTKVTDDQAVYHNGYPRSNDMDIDGNLVVAWQDYRDNDTTFIYMQQVDNQGSSVGHNFRATTVNNNLEGSSSLPSQIAPAVRILRDTIYLAWENFNVDSSINKVIFANIQEWMIPDVTGLDQSEIHPNEVTIYPNPSRGSFSLQFSEVINGSLEMEIYNSAGVLIDKETIEKSGNRMQIELQDIREGIYYLKIHGGSIDSTLPMIIER